MSETVLAVEENSKGQVAKDTIPLENDATLSMPDGGHGWIQVLLSFIVQFIAVGLVNIFGVYQEAYKTDSLFADVSTTQITLIGSVAASCLMLGGIPAGYMAEKYGYRLTALFGSIMMATSLILASFANQVWHILVTQGLLFGFGASIAYFPALFIIPHWFAKKKGMAVGIAVSGSGVGGLVLAPIIRASITGIGIRWTLRITGIVGGFMLCCCSFLLKERLPASKHQEPFSYFKLLTDHRFIRFYLSAVLNSLGYFIPYFFVPLYAVQQGQSAAQGAILIGVLNGASALGRVALGFCADKFGHLEMLTSCLLAAAISITVIWLFAPTMLFVILFGFSVGGFVSLAPNVVVAIFGTKNLGSVTGLVYSGAGVGNLVGPLIAAYLVDLYTTTSENGRVINFFPTMLFGGAGLLLGSLLTLSLKIFPGHKPNGTIY